MTIYMKAHTGCTSFYTSFTNEWAQSLTHRWGHKSFTIGK